MRINFDKDWLFKYEEQTDPQILLHDVKHWYAGCMAGLNYTTADWEKVDLPHDWAIKLQPVQDINQANGHFPTAKHKGVDDAALGGIELKNKAWYRKVFDVPKSANGKVVRLYFEGVYRDCAVLINGTSVFFHESGYTSFYVDISDYLKYGEKNVIAVHVDVTESDGWWYEGAGIYRHVWLDILPPVYILEDETTVKTDVDGNVNAEVTVCNTTDKPASTDVKFTIKRQSVIKKVSVEPYSTAVATFDLKLENVKLWSCDHPNLYEVKISTIEKSEYKLKVGFRSFVFDSEKGFFLNGKRTFIKGGCVHQDFACVGVAMPDSVVEYKVKTLKEYGFNAYRSSHNAASPYLLEMCDKYGILVIDETRHFGTAPADKQELTDMIKRDRNHACIFLWSIGNEEFYVQSEPCGYVMAKKIVDYVRTLDDTRKITYGGNNGDKYEGINQAVDVRGVNYTQCSYKGERNIEKYHKAHPEQPIVATEETSAFYQRAGWVNDAEKKTLDGFDNVMVCYACNAIDWLEWYARRPYMCGAFIWTAIDYYGEPSPFLSNVITSFGAIDVCGYPKPVAYYYKAMWSKEPVLHIFNHWNHKKGDKVKVGVYTNASEVEFVLNGKTIDRVKRRGFAQIEKIIDFEEGTLTAIGYKSGKEVARDSLVTTKEPCALVVTKENEGKDGVNIYTIETIDSNDNVCDTATNELKFNFDGITPLGVGNGDPTSYELNYFYDNVSEEIIKGWKKDGIDTEIETQYIFSGIFKMTLTPTKKDLRREKVVTLTRLDMGEVTTTTYTTEIDSCGEDVILHIDRIVGKFTIRLNGEVIGEDSSYAKRYNYNVHLNSGKNIIEVIINDNCTIVKQEKEVRSGIYGKTSIIRKTPATWHRKLYGGKCMLMTSGKGNFTVSSEGMDPVTVEVE